MKGFVFRLQRALRFALLRENQKKAQIANGLKRISFLKKYLGQLDSKLQTALAQSHSEFHSLLGAAYRQSIIPTMEESKRLKLLLQEEFDAIEARKKELAHLSQRRRSLEALEEKQSAEFRLDRSRKEQKRIDETVNLARARAVSQGKDRY